MRSNAIALETTKLKLLKIFELGSNASWDEVNSQHKKLFLKYHPDKNPNNPAAIEMFKAVSSAYGELDKIYNPQNSANHPPLDEDNIEPKNRSLSDTVAFGTKSEIESLFKHDSNFQHKLLELLYVALKYKRDPSIVRYILNYVPNDAMSFDKFNPEYVNEFYRNLILHEALISQYGLSLIETILQKGANPNRFTLIYEYYSVIGKITSRVERSVIPINIMFHRENEICIFNQEVKNYNFLVTKLLIKYGADINLKVKGLFDFDKTILEDAIDQFYELVTQKSDDVLENEFILILEEYALSYLSGLQALLLYGIDVNYKSADLNQNAVQTIDRLKSALSQSSKSSRYALPINQKNWAIKKMDSMKSMILCREMFDKAVSLVKDRQDGYEKYFIDACKHDYVTYIKLLHHLLGRKGRFRHLILDDNQIKNLCSLAVIQKYAKDDVRKLLSNIYVDEQKVFLQEQQRSFNQVISILDQNDIDKKNKEELISQYEKLIEIKQSETINFSLLVQQAESKIAHRKTAIIKNWDSSFWYGIRQNDKEIEKALFEIEQQIKAKDANANSLLAQYKPIIKNMHFFNKYIMDAITDKENHNLQRVSYCLYFMQNITMRYEEGNKTKPITELLKNLYLLKGVLLAEVHSQSFFQSLFNCAMTSRLSEYVENEIAAIELKSRQNYHNTGAGIDIDNDPEVQKRRTQLISLENAYGTKWRRFKTALLSNKSSIKIDNELNTTRLEALNRCKR